MITFIENKRKNLSYKILCSFVAFAFMSSTVVFTTPGYAQMAPQTVLNLPVAGTMVMPSQAFQPPVIAGITLYPDAPLKFDFIMDIGDDHLQGAALEKESKKLINYFMATLTVPLISLGTFSDNRISILKFSKLPSYNGEPFSL